MKWVPNGISLLRGCIIAPLLFFSSLNYCWKTTFFLLVFGFFTDGLDGFWQ